MTKGEQIKKTLNETKERRKTQDCKVYSCKIDASHLSKKDDEYFDRLFLEAKWLRNFLIGRNEIFKDTYKYDKVTILNKDKEKEEREIKYLSSQMKQGVLEQIKFDIRGLSRKKKKAAALKAKSGSKSKAIPAKYRTGRLKFKSRVNSINLKQHDITYVIHGKNHISLQGYKKKFRVRGLDQIPVGAELANAKLIRKPSGYYLSVTCFIPKVARALTGKENGYDFGIATHITDMHGAKDKWEFKETDRHKKLQRQVSKTYKKGQRSSRNRNKRKALCRLEHEKLTNRKQDAVRKFVSDIKTEYDFVGVQDENIAAWKSSRMRGYGRSVHYSIMGGIISKVKKLSQTVVVDKWEPTSQECLICGKKTKHSLDQRVFVCSHCGHTDDRDVHSAKVVHKKAHEKVARICMDYTDTMPEHTNEMPKEVSTAAGCAPTAQSVSRGR